MTAGDPGRGDVVRRRKELAARVRAGEIAFGSPDFFEQLGIQVLEQAEAFSPLSLMRQVEVCARAKLRAEKASEKSPGGSVADKMLDDFRRMCAQTLGEEHEP